MDFDIFNPPKTKVVAGVEGKTILVYSAERKLGKTLQASRMPKPFYLRFEQGANAIPDMPYAPLTCREGDVYSEEEGKRQALKKLSEKYNRSLYKRLINIYNYFSKILAKEKEFLVVRNLM